MPWGFDPTDPLVNNLNVPYGTFEQPYDGTEPWWGDSVNRGIDVLGAWASRSPYYSPDDPRYRDQRGGYYPPYPPQGGYPGSPVQVPGGVVPGTVNTQGFQINWWTAALLGLLAGAFFLGKRR